METSAAQKISLAEAVRIGSLEEVRQLIAAGASLTVSQNNSPLLHSVVERLKTEGDAIHVPHLFSSCSQQEQQWTNQTHVAGLPCMLLLKA